jgi:hypothetical protein
MDRLESGIEELAAASRYCTSSFGTAALYRARCELDGAEQALPCKRLRRKENVSVVHFELPSAPKSAIAADTKNRNNVNMLDRRFNIAPPPKRPLRVGEALLHLRTRDALSSRVYPGRGPRSMAVMGVLSRASRPHGRTPVLDVRTASSENASCPASRSRLRMGLAARAKLLRSEWQLLAAQSGRWSI